MGPHWTTRFGFEARIFLLSDRFGLIWEPLFLWERERRVTILTHLWLVS